ncbi:MAG: hypothetical protein J6A53_06505 [Clostridia bacterium]|nr:hypothetical protein [Clostridia bacterium]MBO5440288.1 hypothetical protein [Clostridia bacterium]
MRKFNRFIAILLCFLTVLSCFSLLSCDNTPSDTSSDGGSNDTSIDTDTNTDTATKPDQKPDIKPEDEPTIDELNKKNEVLAILDNNFLSRNEIVYKNINGKDVTVYTTFRDKKEIQNNPNFSQIQMLWQAIKYKEKYPERDVYISLSSYRISGTLAGCVKEDSAEYGHLKMLRDKEYDEESGYYRLCYLLCEAARKGIYVTVIGHLNASAVKLSADAKKNTADIDFITYFNNHLNDPCYIEGKVISDYMVALKSKWSLDKGGTDMMHLKACTVSNYIDRYGNDRGKAVWLGCTNIDGVNYLGRNGLDYIQTGAVICDHEEIYRATYNFIQLMSKYQEQEEVLIFRRLCQLRTTMQIDLILAGKGDTIPSDEQIVYLGTESDKVFELYFTPLGGSSSTWDTTYNPYCKYTTKLVSSKNEDGYIEFLLNNPKFINGSFSVAQILLDLLNKKFMDSGNVENNLHLQSPGPDYSIFDGLIEGENIGAKQLNEYRSKNYHTKDVQMSYVEDGTRYYVTLFNSLNFHEGAMFYQTNSILVIKETKETGNDFYIDYAIMTTPDINFEEHRYATDSQ